MRRIPFLSAMSLTGSRDGEGGSYPEIIDELVAHGSSTKADSKELYRRMSFNVLISNVDDHLRNHGFLWSGKGWTLSPAYDLNPTPEDIKVRVLTTAITLDERTCSLDLLEEAAELFGLALPDARAIIKSVATANREWRTVARQTGATRAEMERMASAFEHDDLERALLL